ncbi:EAL domain-containing protein [Pseudomonas sp. HR96]|uniref:sensor domain-containing phosphodiesterase n=1 Tax=Pseudomonas sp. HR96 TaxID=1027966 RepID=UPI002A748983|nr:EAL domain-containing protein [Pseudomonas sp. HR96]WPO97728.1 EAL domain-containing protein [Pseudomonas sp. HR96]
MNVSTEQLVDLVSLKAQPAASSHSVERVLHALRTHLGMDVAFVSEFRDSDRVMRFVDAGDDAPIAQGDALDLDVGYCQRVVDGRLPELIPDTAQVDAAMALPETRAIPIGSHLSVPIRLSDGRLYGTFCCFGYAPDNSLGNRDLQVMRVFADLVTERIESEMTQERDRQRKRERLLAAMATRQPAIVYQPIFDLADMSVAGWECLSRFNLEPGRTPDLWFQEAADVGLGEDLECHAISAALAGLSMFPGDMYLAINCSPELLLSHRLDDLLQGYPGQRIVLEITEHAVVQDYRLMEGALAGLRKRGMRLAIDDAGAGYASMRHILQLRPDMIKLDISLTQGIDLDPQRRAMASALIAFARETGSTIVAEGVETVHELEVLKRLGADKVQGFLLGHPLALSDVKRLNIRAQGGGFGSTMLQAPRVGD